ncbi:glutathione S-transferase C-terminal domain-containing protein, partial [Salmonella enterica subsp. enterica serovar Enteritidis]
EKIEYAVNRYTNEAKRLYGVIDKRLGESKFLGGPDYSIADIATWPWLRSWKNQGIELSDFPKLQRWFEAIEERPAVQRAVKVLAKERPAVQDDKAKEILFGATQYARR